MKESVYTAAFKGLYKAPLFVCLPTPAYIFYLLTYWPTPCRQTKKSAPVLIQAGDAVSKQPNMKMMLTVKADLEVMMLHQIGRKWIWCQQKSSGIEGCCWHQGRILLRWCSIFPKLPSHHHEKASKRYSIGMLSTENHHHAYCMLHEIYDHRHVKLKNPLSCLRRARWKISTAGMVSALKRHRAYGNSHNLG